MYYKADAGLPDEGALPVVEMIRSDRGGVQPVHVAQLKFPVITKTGKPANVLLFLAAPGDKPLAFIAGFTSDYMATQLIPPGGEVPAGMAAGGQ